MKINLDIPNYSINRGITLNWQQGFEISLKFENDCLVLKANREGLYSLANHLINLAQEQVPTGQHLHLDSPNSLEEGSVDLIIEKS